VAGGAALHFLYEAVPNPLTALISPINESVWEHLKLLFWPMLLTAFWLSQNTSDRLCAVERDLCCGADHAAVSAGSLLSAAMRLRRGQPAGSISGCMP
jgi:hypothetical protein